jgi:hypothetical protein
MFARLRTSGFAPICWPPSGGRAVGGRSVLVTDHPSFGRWMRLTRSSDQESSCWIEPLGERNSGQQGPTLRGETLWASTAPEPGYVVHCSLVLPGPVRAEAARKALLWSADRGLAFGPARSRRGSQAGSAMRSLRGDRCRNSTYRSRSAESTTGIRPSWLRNGGSPVGRHGTFPGDSGNDERGDQRHEGIGHREVHGCSRGERSEGCNPKGATGTKQGRKGSRRSARHEAVKNRTCRLPEGGNFGTTCRPVPQASKGKKPQERCQKASARRRPSLVKLRSGDKAMRGWAQVQRIWARGSRGNTSKSTLARGKDMEGVLNQYGTTVQTTKTL